MSEFRFQIINGNKCHPSNGLVSFSIFFFISVFLFVCFVIVVVCVCDFDLVWICPILFCQYLCNSWHDVVRVESHS